MRTWMLLLAFASAAAAVGCGHVQPASSDGVPAPWPKTDPPVVVRKSEPAPPLAPVP